MEVPVTCFWLKYMYYEWRISGCFMHCWYHYFYYSAHQRSWYGDSVHNRPWHAIIFQTYVYFLHFPDSIKEFQTNMLGEAICIMQLYGSANQRSTKESKAGVAQLYGSANQHSTKEGKDGIVQLYMAVLTNAAPRRTRLVLCSYMTVLTSAAPRRARLVHNISHELFDLIMFPYYNTKFLILPCLENALVKFPIFFLLWEAC